MLEKSKFKPTKEIIKAAISVFTNMAKLEIIEPVILDIQRKILNEKQFKWIKNNNVIFNPKHTFAISGEDFQVYCDSIQVEYKKTIFRAIDGRCPLLVAEKELSDAKTKLINMLTPFTGIKKENLFKNGLEDYNKYVDLVLNLIAPYIDTKVPKNYFVERCNRKAFDAIYMENEDIVIYTTRIPIDEDYLATKKRVTFKIIGFDINYADLEELDFINEPKEYIDLFIKIEKTRSFITQEQLKTLSYDNILKMYRTIENMPNIRTVKETTESSVAYLHYINGDEHCYITNRDMIHDNVALQNHTYGFTIKNGIKSELQSIKLFKYVIDGTVLDLDFKPTVVKDIASRLTREGLENFEHPSVTDVNETTLVISYDLGNSEDADRFKNKVNELVENTLDLEASVHINYDESEDKGTDAEWSVADIDINYNTISLEKLKSFIRSVEAI